MTMKCLNPYITGVYPDPMTGRLLEAPMQDSREPMCLVMGGVMVVYVPTWRDEETVYFKLKAVVVRGEE